MLIMIAGDYKTGKTVSSATFPKPMTFFDFDGGFSSIKNTKGKDGKLIIPDWEQIQIVEFYKPKAVSLSFKTDLKSPVAPAHTASSLDIIKQYNDSIIKLFEIESKPKTLVIDSLTTVFRLWKEAILAANNISNLRIADYGTLELVLYGQFLPTLKLLNKQLEYIILINHIDIDKDELMGSILEFPVGPSRNMGRGIGKELDEIWRQREEAGDYVWRTKRSGFFQAGSRLDLPDPIKPATYYRLKEILDLRSKEGGDKK